MKTKTALVLVAAMTLAACTNPATQEKNNQDMKTITINEQQAASLSAIACLEAQGDLARLEPAVKEGLDAGLTVSQVKEALSHLYAYTGFPRSLNALGVLQKVLADNPGRFAEGRDASPLPADYDALRDGTRVQTELTGRSFDFAFAPATDYYLKAHLFGDIFARDNLTHAERELVTVSALSGLKGAEPQLRAHVSGARNMGVTDDQLAGIVSALSSRVGVEEGLRAAAAVAQVTGRELTALIDASEAAMPASPWPVGQPNEAYAQYFIGRSYVAPMDGGVTNVTFEPRCRNNWHVHHGAVQVLMCVYGRGWYQEWGKPAVEMTEGTVIAVPAETKHWHGAAADSWFQHLTYHKDAQPNASNEWLEPVTDEVYDQLSAEK